jgi:hypothetical protein
MPAGYALTGRGPGAERFLVRSVKTAHRAFKEGFCAKRAFWDNRLRIGAKQGEDADVIATPQWPI